MESMFGTRRNNKRTGQLRTRWIALSAVLLLISCASIPDSELQSSISSRLGSNDVFKFVSASVKDGVVSLTGNVPTENDKTLASTFAKIDGVKEIKNYLIVTPPTPEPTAETEVAEEPPSIHYEAQQEAEQYWNRFIFHCGESDFIYSHRPADPKAASRYYDQPLDIYYEMRNLTISTDGDSPTPRTEADRLNEQSSPTGIEWSGKTSVYSSPMRIYLSQDTPDGFTSSGWNKWREESDPVFKVEMSRRNGKWSFGEIRAQGAHGPGPLKRGDCQQVPGS